MRFLLNIGFIALLSVCSQIESFFEDSLEINKPGIQFFVKNISGVGDLVVVQEAKQNQLGNDYLIETRLLLINGSYKDIDSLKYSFLVFAPDSRSYDDLLFTQAFKVGELSTISNEDTLLISRNLPFLKPSQVEISLHELNGSSSFVSGNYHGFLNLLIGDSLVDTGTTQMTIDKDGIVAAYYKKDSDFRIIEGQINRDSLFIGTSTGSVDATINLYSGVKSIVKNGDSLSFKIKQVNSNRNEILSFDLIKEL